MIIANQNFDAPTVRGYVGPGAYFWEFEDSHLAAQELAEAWWLWSVIKGFYKEEADDTRAVIGVELHEPEDDEYADLTTHKFLNLIRTLLGAFDNLNVHEVTAMVLDDLAAERGRNVVLVRTTVKTPMLPKGGFKQSITQEVFPSWPVLVVREGGQKLFSNIFSIQ